LSATALFCQRARLPAQKQQFGTESGTHRAENSP
jgi:hypothetical protein